MVDRMSSRALYQTPRTKSLGWPLMLADMSLLLMAFFALMVAQSGNQAVGQRNALADKAAALEIPKDATSLMASLRDHHLVFEPLDFDIGIAPVSIQPAFTAIDPVDAMFKSFSDQLTSRSFTVARVGEEIIISLGSVGNFAAGSADLDAGAVSSLQTLGDLLGGVSSDISIEGHADASPVAGGRFKDNWDLAGARAAAVLRELSGSPGVAESSMRAVSYGDHRPMAAAGDAKSRDSNRRVEIRIRPN